MFMASKSNLGNSIGPEEQDENMKHSEYPFRGLNFKYDRYNNPQPKEAALTNLQKESLHIPHHRLKKLKEKIKELIENLYDNQPGSYYAYQKELEQISNNYGIDKKILEQSHYLKELEELQSILLDKEISLISEIKNQESTINALSKTINAWEKQKHVAEEQLDGLTKELDYLHNLSANRQKLLSERIEQVKTEIKKYTDYIISLNNHISSSQDELDNPKNKLNELHVEKNFITQQLSKNLISGIKTEAMLVDLSKQYENHLYIYENPEFVGLPSNKAKFDKNTMIQIVENELPEIFTEELEIFPQAVKEFKDEFLGDYTGGF